MLSLRFYVDGVDGGYTSKRKALPEPGQRIVLEGRRVVVRAVAALPKTVADQKGYEAYIFCNPVQ